MDVIRSPVLSLLAPRATAQQGRHRSAGSNSVSGLLSTLIPVFIVSLVLFGVFLLLRRNQRRLYAPRTYIDTLRDQEKTPVAPTGLFGWIKEFRSLPDTYVLNHSSLDGYLFLRFFKMLALMCLVGTCVTWPILLPVYGTGSADASGLSILSFSHLNDPGRYYATCFVAFIFLSFVMFMITRETILFINLREAYLLSPRNASRMSSRTVLFTSVPDHFLDEGRLRRVFPRVRQVWIVTNCDMLQELVDDRDNAAFKLEDAEIQLSKKAIKVYRKRHGRDDSRARPSHIDSEEAGPVAAMLVDGKDRPTHRLKPVIGAKVDTIEWARSALRELIPKVHLVQAAHRTGNAEKISAVFIEFETQRTAQSAFQQVAHHAPVHMTPRAIGVVPEEIIWKNLGLSWWNSMVRSAVATFIITLLILFWSVPVGFVGVLTNIDQLTQIPFLAWIDDIPSSILGVITALLPTLLLALLIILVPVLCRFFAKQFEPTLSLVELKTQSWHFSFQVVQVFLVTTFTSGAAAVARNIVSDPTSAAILLAQQLPTASNFYISYFILYGLAVSASTLLELVPLLKLKVLGKLVDNSPRKMFKRYTQLPSLQWGTVYPKFTNLAVIAIAYSCIAPLVIGFATVGFYLLYLAFRYNFLFVLTNDVDTKGATYARALQQLTAGVYIAELCLIGLFAIGTAGSATSTGPLVLMIIFAVLTVLYHVIMRSALNPLTKFLPSDLFPDEEEEEAATRNAMEEGEYIGNGNTAQHTDSKHVVSDKPRSAPLSNRKQKTPSQKGGTSGMIARFLFPQAHQSYYALKHNLRDSESSHSVLSYPEDVRKEAYTNPVIVSPAPNLWIVKDEIGVSAQEVSQTRKVIPITDEGAHFNEKGKIVWDQEHPQRAPIWEDKIYY